MAIFFVIFIFLYRRIKKFQDELAKTSIQLGGRHLIASDNELLICPFVIDSSALNPLLSMSGSLDKVLKQLERIDYLKVDKSSIIKVARKKRFVRRSNYRYYYAISFNNPKNDLELCYYLFGGCHKEFEEFISSALGMKVEKEENSFRPKRGFIQSIIWLIAMFLFFYFQKKYGQ